MQTMHSLAYFLYPALRSRMSLQLQFPVLALTYLFLLQLSLALEPAGFRVDLIHPASPSIASQKTRAEIVQNLVRKSNARVKYLVNNFAKSPDFESPVSPDGGAYVMQIQVGTPPQSFTTAIADTGSDLVWLQCDSCFGCSGNTYDPSSSSDYSPIDCSSDECSALSSNLCSGGSQCQYLYQYGSGMTMGTFGKDTVHLGSKGKFPSIDVGCGQLNQGFDGFEGLVGLGQGPVSLTSQLASAIDNKFSYCLVDINNAKASSPLFFGPSAALNGSGIQSTPILPSDQYPTYYLLKVTGITAGGKPVGEPGSTIIDSGTTLTYVPSGVYSKVKSTFQSLIHLPPANGSSIGLDLCYDVSSNKKYKFPSLSVQLDGATLAPPASNYFLAIDESGDTVCLAMGTAEGLPVSIIGNVMQQGYHILYDRGASKLSFVKEKCESL